MPNIDQPKKLRRISSARFVLVRVLEMLKVSDNLNVEMLNTDPAWTELAMSGLL